MFASETLAKGDAVCLDFSVSTYGLGNNVKKAAVGAQLTKQAVGIAAEAVTVSGTPTLTLSNSATASYTSGTGNTALVFTYTVADGDGDTSDLLISSYSGTITDAAGGAAAAGPVVSPPACARDTQKNRLTKVYTHN